jgi:hypothetical protein
MTEKQLEKTIEKRNKLVEKLEKILDRKTMLKVFELIDLEFAIEAECNK